MPNREQDMLPVPNYRFKQLEKDFGNHRTDYKQFEDDVEKFIHDQDLINQATNLKFEALDKWVREIEQAVLGPRKTIMNAIIVALCSGGVSIALQIFR
jgi:hypothetical protein